MENRTETLRNGQAVRIVFNKYKGEQNAKCFGTELYCASDNITCMVNAFVQKLG